MEVNLFVLGDAEFEHNTLEREVAKAMDLDGIRVSTFVPKLLDWLGPKPIKR